MNKTAGLGIVLLAMLAATAAAQTPMYCDHYAYSTSYYWVTGPTCLAARSAFLEQALPEAQAICGGANKICGSISTQIICYSSDGQYAVEGVMIFGCKIGIATATSGPSWGGFVKPMPGTVCTMNVGNAVPWAGYTNKIRNCSEATERRDGVASGECDVINIIELNSNDQCKCACDPATGTARDKICTDNSFDYDPDRCSLCQGCGSTLKTPSCQTQAETICDPQQYYPPVCTEVPSKGCDCMCFRKGPCSLGGGGSCTSSIIQTPAGCDVGNYATCRKCDLDGDGSYDWGSCVAHPPHCNGIGYILPELRQECLQRCSTPIMEGAAQFLANVKVRTISGDLNCDPEGCDAFGECPWIPLMAGYGLEICGYETGTTFGDLCAVDLVLSNSCGCGVQTNVAGPGDHATIVYDSTPGSWTGPLTEILSANSASSCPEPDATDPFSDGLGSSASCIPYESGWPACSSWGHTTSAKIRYYTRVDDCYLQPEMGIPEVLVCDIASASASASCSVGASSSSSAFVTLGQASASTSASCSNGSAYNPPTASVFKSEFMTPSLVRRSDGNLYFMVERNARRDLGAQCSVDY